jgi:hypothetical protein
VSEFIGPPKPYRVRVYHRDYGCDTGCCGHVVELADPSGHKKRQFEFVHNYDNKRSMRAWAEKLVRDVVSAGWPQCLDSIDWDSLDLEGVLDV